MSEPYGTPAYVSPSGLTRLYHADCLDWLRAYPGHSIHAVVTDPPYGMLEYTPEQVSKLRNGHGGVWRIPPAIGGHQRQPLPRFTVLGDKDIAALHSFFRAWATVLFPVLVPGAHVLIATSPLFNHVVSQAMVDSKFEKRGEIVRLTQTLRGGDRPKNAEDEFPEVSVMPRSQWEPWVILRKPCEGRVSDNLRRWKTGGFRRPSRDRPFGDVIESSPTRREERAIAPHPSLKPQAFLREVVRAVLPLGEGTVLDPFAGSGSTLAACEWLGYSAIGIESDLTYIEMAKEAIPRLSRIGPPLSLLWELASVDSGDPGTPHSPPTSVRPTS
ncbi:MAG: site-specific DNA-methyltransferase [Chloroflexi bacterium]|nr:site-specific DNA-methyltransferase [Chloroflexota bacterium]